MRPKVVILTLVAAFGLLAIVAVLKGVGGKNVDEANGAAGPQLAVEADANAQATNINGHLHGVNPTSSNALAMAEQIRAAGIAAEMETIQSILGQADGTNNPTVIAALIEKMAHPEAEVRKGAVDALIQLNDTNAVPGLQLASETIKDPREKVSVMDAIDYLKLPSMMQDVPPDSMTNDIADSNTGSRPRPAKNMNPNAQHGKKHKPQPVPVQNGAATQPQ